MNLSKPLLAAGLSVLAAAPIGAGAVVYIGNPNLHFYVDRPAGDYINGAVTLHKVRVHHCGGGSTDYVENASIDPVAGYDVAIGAGNHCGLTFYWSSAMDIDGSGFTVRYAETSTAVTLDSVIEPVALAPCSVLSGSMSGVCPRLYVTID